MRTAIIGGGAAGFFAAICLKEMRPEMEVCIFERANRVLRKVEVSGGGRCNCTNTFAEVSDLKQVYPRGHRLLKRLFKDFGPKDAYAWFEQHGVRLTTQEDQCVFPASQDSHTIINMFLAEARRHRIAIKTGTKISSLDGLRQDFDFIVVTTGGSPRKEGLTWLGQEVVTPVPSLFTFSIDDDGLKSLMGTVVQEAAVHIPGSKLRTTGPILITHWGMSGPAVLRLSSYAARELADHDCHLPLCVNWACATEAEVQQELSKVAMRNPGKQVGGMHPFDLPARLWSYLAGKCLGARSQCRWQDINKKEMNRLTNILTNDCYEIAGRAAFKDEFVTCGGIALSAVDAATLESKTTPHLYFAGEVLDIDGTTGGFNFQAAWTTAHTVARAIARTAEER